MEIDSVLERLGLALAIGFLVGVERGWKQRAEGEGQRAAGLRTFALIGLLGGVAGQLGVLLGEITFLAVALAFGAAFTVFKFREHVEEDDYSATGLIAGLLVFSLGAYAQVGDVAAVAAAAVAIALILAFKESLHSWLRTLTWPEIRSALLILAMTLIALPVLPNRPLDPYGAFNPRELWLLTILIATASFAGYVSLRAFGATSGLYVGAAAGALVSSTAATLDIARRVRAEAVSAVGGAAAASLASAIMIARIGAISLAFAGAAFPHLAMVLLATGAAALLLAACLFALDRRQTPNVAFSLHSPLDFRSVARFALVLCALTVAARLAAAWFGDRGALAFAATAGLVDVDAVTLAVGRLVATGTSPVLAADAILLAAAVDTVSKSGIALWAGGRRMGAWFGAASFATILVGAAVWFLTR